MAISEQKTGFRLPWASEPRIGSASGEAGPDLSETSTEPPTAEATVTQDTGTATIDPRSSISWPTMNGAPDASAEDSPEVAAEATSEDAHVEAPARAAGPDKARRENPLVAGLVRAMRDAAQTAQSESLTRFAETAKARVETIHAESAESAAAIRRQSDQDISGIRDWSKAEMARVREETDERIADRKRKLELEVDDHAARVEHRIELVQGAVARFEGEMERFFKALLAEEDPARLAGFAQQLPEPPTLDDDPSIDRWVPTRTLDAGDAAAAEADFLANIKVTDFDPDDETQTIDLIGVTEPETIEAPVEATAEAPVEATAEASAEASADVPAEEAAEATAEVPAEEAIEASNDAAPEATAEATAEPVATGDDDAIERLATFTDPASGRDARATTRLSVVGLVSVASIAGFKRAINRGAGVSGVSVASGPNGDFIFTVQHAASTDLRTLIPELDGFAASVTGDAEGVLSVSASEPGEAS